MSKVNKHNKLLTRKANKQQHCSHC